MTVKHHLVHHHRLVVAGKVAVGLVENSAMVQSVAPSEVATEEATGAPLVRGRRRKRATLVAGSVAAPEVGSVVASAD